MKTLITVIVLSVFAYASVGALMQTVETKKAHAERIDNALALIK
jgi:hypothetical protein